VKVAELLLVACAVLAPACAARAHEVRPAYVEISARADGYRVVWKQPLASLSTTPLTLRLSGGALDGRPSQVERSAAYQVLTWDVSTPTPPLDGQRLQIEGLDRGITDALVRIVSPAGATATYRLTPDAPALTVATGANPGGGSLPVAAYLPLGVEHILLGFDHLLFVLGLLLIVGHGRRLLWTITAFTVAHSLTLALAALGVVTVPAALVEAAIALSIVFVAVEVVNLWRGRPGLSTRWPWAVAFAFGLLHGLGFASALADIGLPPDAVAPALLLFNVGVELGQLAFVAVAVLVVAALRDRLPPRLAVARWCAPYAIGGLAAYWFIERAVSVFSA
jgi:hydrogenase/urease accessory protein HupE